MAAANLQDDEFLQTIDFDALELLASSATCVSNMNFQLKLPEIVEPIDMPPSRFATVKEDDIRRLQEDNQSSSTKRNTKWGIKIFQGC